MFSIIKPGHSRLLELEKKGRDLFIRIRTRTVLQLLTHCARQDRENGNLNDKQNHATKVTKIRKNKVNKMT